MAAQSDFISACETGDADAVTRILKEEVVVSADELQKGLSRAAWRGHPAVANILLSKGEGARVDRMSLVGSVNHGSDPTMFDLFVKYHGFDINSTEFDEGCTPLRLSVGNENLTRWLLAHGADPNVVAHDRSSTSPLVSAAVTEKGGSAVRMLCEEHGASSRTRMSDRRERLVRAGANINYIDPKRKGTPLHCAVVYNRGDVVEALIELGKADPNVVFQGQTAADVALDRDSYEFLKDKTKVTPERGVGCEP
ncbi:ankyrin repeat-containing domain protein [Copromyces sp. CBS 386.78]|nr:ankyrin repeat-containing domain protein [Copromyces sp. CBS 386.78]